MFATLNCVRGLASRAARIPVLARTMATIGTPRRQFPAYSEPDQVKRHAIAVESKNARVLDVDSVYDGSWFAGKRVVITGGAQGLGLELARELLPLGANVGVICLQTSDELDALGEIDVHEAVDVTDEAACATMAANMAADGSGNIDVLINNAGYFYGGPTESVINDTMHFGQQILQINICAAGPLRITNALFQAGLLHEGAKNVIITSQAGSCEWRATQNAGIGGDYGHHMSRAACNIGGVLLAEELKPKGIAVGLFHPGFNRTTMTARYADIWDIEGAVEPDVGARRVLHETTRLSLDTSGDFINCEDGKPIPW